MSTSFLDLAFTFQPPPSAGGGGASTSAPSDGGGGGGGGGMPPEGCMMNAGLFLMLGIMMFFMFRNSKKEKEQREAMLKALQKGAIVRTTGGLRGEITKLGDGDVTLEIADRVRVNVRLKNIEGPDKPAGDSKEKKTEE